MPVFFRAGCNAGSCHGSARGKDGFRLSLFGYDPAGDYFRLTQQMVGRRVNLAEPEQSLILLKATGKVVHTGGELFKADSPYYQTLLRWIEAGAPDDAASIPEVTGIDLDPAKLLFNGAGAPQPTRVLAHYSDGARRDVTNLARFITNNKATAEIDENGVVKAAKPGDTFVFARFSRFTVGAEVIVLPEGDRYQWPDDVRPANYVDEMVFARLRKLHLVPSEVCDDATFLRRASLDLIGLPPTVEEYRRFMADPSPEKRAALVDALLKRPEFADLWAAKWGEWLRLAGSGYTPEGNDHKAAQIYYEWITDAMARGEPWDRFVRDQIVASGSNLHDAPANLYTMLPQDVKLDSKELAQNVAQLFTGIRIQCAQCHNHPFDRWTMDDYYGLVSRFTGVRRKAGAEPREWFIFYNPAAPPANHLTDGRPMPARMLGGTAPVPAGQDPRAALAEWLTSRDNEFFARNIANRVWGHFFSRGIIEPVDDLRVTNPPSNKDLLDALAARFVAGNFDARKLIRDICTSRTYQASAKPNSTNRSDERQFSRATLHRLRADVLLDALCRATDTDADLPGFPRGTRAVQFYPRNPGNFNPRAGTYFFDTFGRSRRGSVCACETHSEPTLSQTLHLINGDTIAQKLDGSPVIPDLLKAGRSPGEIIDVFYIRALARGPSPDELAALLPMTRAHPRDRKAYDDIFWALVNSTEFAFNH